MSKNYCFDNEIKLVQEGNMNNPTSDAIDRMRKQPTVSWVGFFTKTSGTCKNEKNIILRGHKPSSLNLQPATNQS